jgi:hypothetical protein
MKTTQVALVTLAVVSLAPVAYAEDAVVPDEFERQQQAVGACDAYGTGFFMLPGTGTCARVSGHVRYEKSFSKGGSGSGGQTTLDFETRRD